MQQQHSSDEALSDSTTNRTFVKYHRIATTAVVVIVHDDNTNSVWMPLFVIASGVCRCGRRRRRKKRRRGRKRRKRRSLSAAEKRCRQRCSNAPSPHAAHTKDRVSDSHLKLVGEVMPK